MRRTERTAEPGPSPHLKRGQFFGTGHTLPASRDFGFAETRYAPWTYLPRHGHESAYLSFVLHGRYVETVGSRTWDCGVNTLRFHPPGEEHTDRFGGSGGVCLNIELPSSWLSAFPGAGLREPAVSDECAAAALSLQRLLRRGTADPDHTVEELVLALLEACIRGRALGEVPTRVPWWPRLVEYVEAHLSERIALDRAAAATGVHPTHLARTVRARTGATLGDYVRRRRIARAQAMLRLEPRRSLARVAFGLGFADHAHFSRTFKAITGLTPREFRAIA
jgi:AraC family transcriptional regulator